MPSRRSMYSWCPTYTHAFSINFDYIKNSLLSCICS